MRAFVLPLLLLPFLLASAPLAAQMWKNGPAQPTAPPRTVKPRKKKAPPRVPQVDLNRATRAELRKIPGFSAPIVDRILAGRPFHSKADIVVRGLVPEATFLAVRERIKVTYLPPAGAAPSR